MFDDDFDPDVLALMTASGPWRENPRDLSTLFATCPVCSLPTPLSNGQTLFLRQYNGTTTVNCAAGCSPRAVIRGLRRVAADAFADQDLWHVEVALMRLERTGHFGRADRDRLAA